MHCNTILEFTRGCTVTVTCIKCQSKTVLLIPLNTFSNCVTDVWNSLPDFIVSASSLNDFKKRVHSADLSKFLTIV